MRRKTIGVMATAMMAVTLVPAATADNPEFTLPKDEVAAIVAAVIAFNTTTQEEAEVMQAAIVENATAMPDILLDVDPEDLLAGDTDKLPVSEALNISLAVGTFEDQVINHALLGELINGAVWDNASRALDTKEDEIQNQTLPAAADAVEAIGANVNHFVDEFTAAVCDDVAPSSPDDCRASSTAGHARDEAAEAQRDGTAGVCKTYGILSVVVEVLNELLDFTGEEETLPPPPPVPGGVCGP